MKRLQPMIINDVDIINQIAENFRLTKTSYPHLRRHLNDFLRAYEEYERNCGNPWLLSEPIIPENLKDALRVHYDSPPDSVNYLGRLRNSSPEVCPMCGGFHPRTLDHYLPKANFATWAIFSKNLVPACGCNMARGDVVKHINDQNIRILHPYYDDVLKQRILTTEISHSNNFKWIKAKV